MLARDPLRGFYRHHLPYEIEPRCFFTDPSCLVIAPTPLVVTVNGVAGAAVNLEPVADRIHFLTACDTVVPSGNGIAPLNGLSCQPLVMHADGSPVTQASPAQGTEELVAYAVGLGLTNPAVPTGQASATAIPTYEDFLLDFNFRPNALATQPILPAFLAATGLATNLNTPLFSGLVPGYVGLYQINFIVPPPPAGIEACSGAVQSNLTVSLGGQSSFDGAGICIAP
jgi:hypothetical protein